MSENDQHPLPFPYREGDISYIIWGGGGSESGREKKKDEIGVKGKTETKIQK
jgi:hypothetical protein